MAAGRGADPFIDDCRRVGVLLVWLKLTFGDGACEISLSRSALALSEERRATEETTNCRPAPIDADVS